MNLHFISTMLLFPFVFTLVAGENIALMKPAVQGSTANSYTADKAVDGYHGTNADRGDCAHVRSISWWIVDLQQVYLLNRIVIYNREVNQDRLDDLTVEGFLTEPQFSPKSFLCAYNPGSSGDIVTLTCGSGTLGRYVRLSGKTSMTLCEVEIHGVKAMTSPGCDFEDVPFLQGVTSTPATELGAAEDRAYCSALCHRQSTCNVAGYNNVTKMCTSHVTPILPVADSGTSLFSVP